MWLDVDHNSKEPALGTRYSHKRVVSFSHTSELTGLYFDLTSLLLVLPCQHGAELGSIRPVQLPVL